MKTDQKSPAVVGNLKTGRLGRLKPRLKLPPKAGVAIVIMLILLGLLLLFSNDIKNFVSGNICDNSVANRYNLANRSTDNFAGNIKAIAQEVESKYGYSKDITCVYIVYRHYAYIQDVDRSRQLLELIKSLHHKGRRIDSAVLDQQPIEAMEMYVKSLEHNRGIGDESDGSG